MVFNAPQGLTSFLSTLISCPIHSTHYYNNSKTHYIYSFLCLLFCLLPEPGMLFPLWKPAWLIVQDSDQMPAFLPQSCQLQFFFKFCSIILLHSSVYNINFSLVMYFLYYVSTAHNTVLTMQLFIFVSQVYFCLWLFHVFSRMEKSSWEIHERRMKEQYLMAIADKDQQLSHLQNLMRELRSSSSPTETHKVQYQRQVSDFRADCYSEVTTTQETSASCKLSAHLPLLGKPSDDFLWGGQGFWKEGFKHEQC